MVARRNHASPPLKRTFARLSKIERNPQLGHSSVSEGQTQFIGEESWSLLGSGLVQGLLRILGELGVEGTLTITGQVNGSGDITWMGTFTLTDGGTITVGSGGTITVGSGGKITVEGDIPLTIGPTSAAGLPGVEFSSGGKYIGNVAGSTIVSPDGGALLGVYNSTVAMQNGANGVSVGDDRTQVSGDLTVTGTKVNLSSLPATSSGLAFGDLWRDGDVVKVKPS